MEKFEKTYDLSIFALSDISSDARSLNFARAAAEFGYKVAVIAMVENNKIEQYQAEGIDIFPVNLTPNSRPFKQILSYNLKIIPLSNRLKTGIILASDLYSLPAAAIFKSRQNSKLLYDSREIYSALGPLASKKIKQKILTFIERSYISSADRIIVSGPLDADVLKEIYSIDTPMDVILNVPPYKKPIESNIAREQLKISDENRIIIYQGKLLPGRGILQTIEAMKYIDNAVLVILGDGQLEPEIRRKIKQENLSNRVKLAGLIPYDELHSWTCSADIGIALFEPVSLSYELALPNKLFEYCMAGVPTIASDLPAMRQIVQLHEIAKLVPPSLKPEKIAEVIKNLLEHQNYSSITDNCRKYSQIYSYQSQKNLIRSIIKAI